MIVNAIGRQWILPENVDSSLSSKFRIRLARDGTVMEVSLMVSSGDAVLDRSAQTAIYKASPLPVPADTETFELFRDISLTVKPENVRG
jgi:colicin import membrane protein